MQKIYLSRRNLLTLLSKLDRAKEGEITCCTVIKRDNRHPRYPQGPVSVAIIAIDDAEYYTDREPGQVHPRDVPRIGV